MLVKSARKSHKQCRQSYMVVRKYENGKNNLHGKYILMYNHICFQIFLALRLLLKASIWKY